MKINGESNRVQTSVARTAGNNENTGTPADGCSIDTFESASSDEKENCSGLRRIGKNFIGAAFRISGMPTLTLAKPISGKKAEKMLETLKPGDILLMNYQNALGWRVSEKIGIGTDYGHVAIYEGNGNIINADGSKVVREDLKKSITGKRMKIDIVRPDYKTPEDRQAAIKYVQSQIGKPYDSEFKTRDENSHYCSELVMHAFEKMPNPIHLPVKKLLGTEIVSPNAFKNTGKMVYSDRDSFIKTLANGAPAIMAYALPITALACVASGPANTVVTMLPAFIMGFLVNAIGASFQQDAARK